MPAPTEIGGNGWQPQDSLASQPPISCQRWHVPLSLTLAYPAKVDALHSTGEVTPLSYLYRQELSFAVCSRLPFPRPQWGFKRILADCRQPNPYHS